MIPKPGLLRSALSRKILLGIVPIFLVFISVSVMLQNHFQEQEMVEQAQVSAHTYADIIRESLVSMMVNNREVDGTFIDRLTEIKQFDTLHIIVNNLRLRQELMTPEQAERLRVKYLTLAPRDTSEKEVLKTGRPRFSEERGEFRAVIPFNATSVCQKCHAVPVGYTLGATALRVSLAAVSAAATGNWKRSSLIFLIFAVLVIGVASYMFRRFVSRPVEGLVTATREISMGNLEHSVLPVTMQQERNGKEQSPDELAFLALRFDEMRNSLREKINQLDLANQTLSRRNQEVEEALARLRRMQEELVRSERLAVTGRMTAQLSHEINNPIHNIQSLLESTLRKLNTTEQARELVTVALEEVSRMAKLTRQMLDFYRGSVVELERDPVNVSDLLQEVARANQELFSAHNVSITLDLQVPIPWVRGSQDKLKQVLLNLLLNAKDAMPEGGTVTLRGQASEGTAQIEIQDTGIGIPPENIGRVFDAFFTTKKQVSGVGLGLSVCYGIMQQHNGTISVTSEVGKGSTFVIKLPAAGEMYG